MTSVSGCGRMVLSHFHVRTMGIIKAVELWDLFYAKLYKITSVRQKVGLKALLDTN